MSTPNDTAVSRPGPQHPELLSESAADVTFEGSNDGILTWVSAGVEQLLGWRPADLISRPFISLVAPEDVDMVRQVQQQLREGQPGRMRLRIRRADGGARWVDVTVKPRCDDAGHVLDRYGSWHDVQAEVETEQALRDAVALRAAMFASMLDPMVLLEAVRDADGRICDFFYRDANPAACEYNRLTRDELIGRRLLQLLPAHAATTLIADYARVVETGTPLVLDDYAYPREVFGGEERFYDIRAVKLDDGLTYTWRDVTERHHSRERLAASEQRYRLIAENSSDVITLIVDGKVAWISPSVEAISGQPPSAWIGTDATAAILPEDLPLYAEAIEAIGKGAVRVTRTRFVGPDGQIHWAETSGKTYYDADGKPAGIIATMRMADGLVRAEELLAHAARHDALTGLLNRAEGLHRFAGLDRRTARTETATAVLFCDIDHFKQVNDVFGHAVGDEVLQELGDRVVACIRADDLAARMGGDEFLVVLTGVHSPEEAAQVAESIRAAAAQPIALSDGSSIGTTMSIGVTLAREGQAIDETIERADQAMYQAKRAGRDQVILIP